MGMLGRHLQPGERYARMKCLGHVFIYFFGGGGGGGGGEGKLFFFYILNLRTQINLSIPMLQLCFIFSKNARHKNLIVGPNPR
jgi:hypothetical protein